MRVVLYTHHDMFEPALSLAAALAESAEVHLLLEVPPGAAPTANFEAVIDAAPTGLVLADPVLAPYYPSSVRQMWRKAASFHLVLPGNRRARHPSTILLMLRVLRWIRGLQPDVLHVDDVDVSSRLALALALSRAPCPILVGCHDPTRHSGERRWRRKRLTRMLLFKRASACLVHHEAGAEELRRRHPRLRGAVHVVRLATYTFLRDLSRTPSADPDGPVVLMFGRIALYKGLEELLRAAPQVARAVPGVRFVVAGRPVDGYPPPEPPRLANGGSVETTYNYVPNDEIGPLFRAATVAVCPYTDASQSGVVLTAYAFGCPVVATDVGGLPEYVEHGVTGLVVPAGDRDALAAALIRCLTDHGFMQTLRAGVAEASESWLSWRSASSRLVGVYDAVASSTGGSTRRRRRRLTRKG